MTLNQFLLKHNVPVKFLGLFPGIFIEDEEKTESLWQFSNDGDKQGFRSPVLKGFEMRLGLSFEAGSRSNVCFANHEEVRPEFRTSFTAEELVEYVLGFMTENEAGTGGANDKFILPYPSDAEFFWEMVEEGKRKKLI